MYYIYKILNNINNKFYIGSTNNYKRRWYQHKYKLKNNKHCNIYLQHAWNKYGKDNFEFIILEDGLTDDKNIQFEREQYFLDTLNPFHPNGYNISKMANIGGFADKDYEYLYGDNSNKSIYTNEQIILCKKMITQGYKNKDISKKLNINIHTVDSVYNLDSWINVGSEYNDMILNNKLHNKLDIDKPKILQDYLEGLNISQLNKKYKYSNKTISKIINWYTAENNDGLFVCECCGETFIRNRMKTSNIKKIRYCKNQKYCKSCTKNIKY